MLSTTFRLAHKANACQDSYKAVAKALGGIRAYGKDTPIPLVKVLEIQGLDDALWCLRCTEQSADKLVRLFACDCAEHVLPLFEKRYPKDKRPQQAIEAAREYANDEITLEELRAAADATWSAGDAAGEAGEAAGRGWPTEKFLVLLGK